MEASIQTVSLTLSVSHIHIHTRAHTHTHTHTHMHTCTHALSLKDHLYSVEHQAAERWEDRKRAGLFEELGSQFTIATLHYLYCRPPPSLSPSPHPLHDRAQGKSGAEYRATGSSFKYPFIHTHNMSREPLLCVCHSFPSLAPITESQFSPLRSLLLLSPPPMFSLLTTLSPGGLWQEA